MNENLEKINRTINDILVLVKEDNVITNRLDVFYHLACNVKKVLSECLVNVEKIDYSQVSKMGLFENIELVNRFYEKHGIEFDIEKYIRNGVIDFRYYDLDSIDSRFASGWAGANPANNVIIPNNGLVISGIVAVHEFSHLRNFPSVPRSQVNMLLTEPLAFAEELIYCDYLEEAGYNDGLTMWRDKRYSFFQNLVNELIPRYQMFILFKELGSISESNYELYFKTKDGYDILEKQMDEEKIKKIHVSTRYLLAISIGTYMYNEYRKDKTFMQKINELHDKINQDNIFVCLKHIGLNDLGKEDVEKLMESLKINFTLVEDKYTK